VLEDVLRTVEERVAAGEGVLEADACRVVWVNPVADLRAMNVFEDMGGALAGTEYLFRHALDPIRTDRPPLEALAEAALRDPMIGTADFRARIIIEDARRYGAEGVIVSGIPGASHCATEGHVIREEVERALGLPVLEITVPPLADASIGQIAARLEGFFDVIRTRRHHG
jgi:benzoyl-CoA reductase/2-hydroxyglutaryl-CoA dehydratase subunit BcrC/BadD/HgdB